jgi:hypothetical protein
VNAPFRYAKHRSVDLRCEDSVEPEYKELFARSLRVAASLAASRNVLEFVQVQLCPAGFVLPRLAAHGVLHRVDSGRSSAKG